MVYPIPHEGDAGLDARTRHILLERLAHELLTELREIDSPPELYDEVTDGYSSDPDASPGTCWGAKRPPWLKPGSIQAPCINQVEANKS